jgi:hypothetical protein
LAYLIAIAIYLGLAIVLYGLSRFIHDYLYTEVPEDLYWRAPAAAGVIWGLTLAWPLLFTALFDRVWPISFNQMFLFATAESSRPVEEFTFSEANREPRRYRKVGSAQSPTGFEYRADNGSRIPDIDEWPATIEVKTAPDDQRHKGGTVRLERRIEGQNRDVFVDSNGHYMDESSIGRLTEPRRGQFFLNLFVLLLAWGSWFAALTFLLLFQPHHAFVFSLVGFLIWGFVLNFFYA